MTYVDTVQKDSLGLVPRTDGETRRSLSKLYQRVTSLTYYVPSKYLVFTRVPFLQSRHNTVLQIILRFNHLSTVHRKSELLK